MKKRKMTQKIGNHIRPEFRRLLKAYVKIRDLAALLGCSEHHIGMCKVRGHLGKKLAYKAEVLTNYKFKARLMAKKGAIK